VDCKPEHRRTWLKLCVVVAIIGGTAVASIIGWICLAADEPLLALRAIAVLVPAVGVTASAAVTAVFLWLSDSPIMTAALTFLGNNAPKPTLCLVENNHRPTGS
jgi:hypothetical protein